MFAEDDSPYAYAGQSFDDVWHVGWLARGHSFRRGAVAESELQHLRRLAVTSVARRMRGHHTCDLCPFWQRWRRKPAAEQVDSEVVYLGTAEIWVPRRRGGYWASPDLMVHYVTRHHYRPSDEYLEDMMAHAPPEGWLPPKLVDLGFLS